MMPPAAKGDINETVGGKDNLESVCVCTNHGSTAGAGAGDVDYAFMEDSTDVPGENTCIGGATVTGIPQPQSGARTRTGSTAKELEYEPLCAPEDGQALLCSTAVKVKPALRNQFFTAANVDKVATIVATSLVFYTLTMLNLL